MNIERNLSLARQVLVHAGTGGVGLAAINIARALKCPITATAGTPQKRSLLRDLGVQAAASSRDTTFLDVTSCTSGGESIHLLGTLLILEAWPKQGHCCMYEA